MPGLDRGLAGILDNAVAKNEIGTSEEFINSEQGGVRFLSRIVSTKYGGSDPKQAGKTLESAARITGLGNVAKMTMAARDAGFAPIRDRLSWASDSSSKLMVQEGMTETVDKGFGKTGYALWITPFFKKGTTMGMEAGAYDADSQFGLGGTAFGFDFTPNESVRMGMAAVIGGGFAEGGGDLASTTNNASFWGIGAYAGWRKHDFGLYGDITFLSAHNRLAQDLPEAMRMAALSAELDSRILSTGITAEYRIKTDLVDIVPHAGVRFSWIAMDGFDVESGGRKIMEGSAADQKIWSFPVGVTFSKDIETKGGWKVRPSLDLSVTPTVGDLDTKTRVRFSGVSGGTTMSTQTIGGLAFGARAGLEVSKDNLKFGLNYDLQAGPHGTEHGIQATFTWEF